MSFPASFMGFKRKHLCVDVYSTCDYISFLVHPGAVALKSCKRLQQQSLQFDNTTLHRLALFMGFICFHWFAWHSESTMFAEYSCCCAFHCSWVSLLYQQFGCSSLCKANVAVCATRLHWSVPEPILLDSCSPNIRPHLRWKFAQNGQLCQQRHVNTNYLIGGWFSCLFSLENMCLH